MNDDTDQLEQLQLRGEMLRRKNAHVRQEILDLLAVPERGVVTVVYDADGLLSAIDIDAEARVGLSPHQLVHEINAAFLRAGSVGSGFSAPVADPNQRPSHNSARVMAISAALASGAAPEPQHISNDLGTVSIIAMLGSIVGVECSASWITSTPDRLISDEIVRMARIAAKQTDITGRFA